MQSTKDEQLDDLLILWHNHMSSSRVGRGYDHKATVVGDFRVSRQWDDANGALDDELDIARVGAVERAVQELVDPYRTAIYCVARGLVVGRTVWDSPRLPRDEAERAAVVKLARNQMISRLSRAGVVL